MQRFVRETRGYTAVQLLVVIATIGILGAVTMPRIVRALEAGAVHDMKTDVHNLAVVEAAEWEENKTYADPETLAANGTWKLARGVRIDSTARNGERVYVRLAHAATGKKCSLDLSYEDRTAENVTRCWGGTGSPPEGTSALGADFEVSDASTGVVAATYTTGTALRFTPSLTEAARATSFTWTFTGASALQGRGAPGPVDRTFGTPGEITVTLAVEDRLGGEATASKTVRLVDPASVRPDAEFAYSPNGAEPGARISFDGRLSSHPRGYDKLQSFAWELGDGTTAHGDQAGHTYAAPGDYPVTLIVTDVSGAADTTQHLVSVRSSGFVPDFSWAPTTPAAGVGVSFQADTLRVGTGGSYVFNFSDGTRAPGPRPTYTFPAEGTFPVTLTATNAAGAVRSVTRSVTVLPAAGTAPSAQFTCTPNGLSADFDASASSDGGAGPLQYVFDFGDFTSAAGPIARHTYTAPGTYPVKLTVRNAAGREAATTRSCSVSDLAAAPWADFTATPSDLRVSLDASASTGGRASDGSPYAICEIRWDLGDGTTARGQVVDHTYATAGDYTVRVTVLSCSGQSAQSTRTVRVNRVPVAEFSYAPSPPQANQALRFDGSRSRDPDGQSLTYRWTFGNGATAEGSTPSYSYTTGGSYTVTLTVTDAFGASHTTSQSVSVNSAPTAAFTVTPTTPVAGQPVVFDASTSTDPDGDVLSYSWSFGTGSSTGSGVNATFTYPTGGTYPVRLTVTDSRGGEHSTTRSVTVNTSPTVSLTANGSSGALTVLVGEAVAFAASASDPDGDAITYSLSLGDGTTADGATHSKTYGAAGSYSAWAIATDAHGASAQSNTITVTVQDNRCLDASARNYGETLPCRYNQAPWVNLAVNGGSGPVSVAVGQAVSIAASGGDPDGDPVTYQVAFGDGTTAQGPNHGKAYSSPGTYYVQASISDAAGATASSNQVQINVASATCQDPGAENFGQALPCWYLQSPTITGPGNQMDWGIGEQRGFSYTLRNPNAVGRYYCLRIRSSNSTVIGAVGGDGPDACGIWIGANSSVSFGPHHLMAHTAGTATVTALVYDQAKTDRQGSMAFENQAFDQTCRDQTARNYGGALPCVYNQPPSPSFSMRDGHNLCHKVIYYADANGSDPDGWIANYKWTIVWNGVTYGAVSGDGTPNIRFEGPVSRRVEVTLTVTDNEGLQASNTYSFTAAAGECPSP